MCGNIFRFTRKLMLSDRLRDILYSFFQNLHSLTPKGMAQKNIPGFTLTELLLSIAIIGLLSAIVVAAVNPLRVFTAVTDIQRLIAVHSLNRALNTYQIDHSDWPGGGAILVGKANAKDICRYNLPSVNCISIDALVPVYLAKVPEDPGELNLRATGYRAFLDGDFIAVEASNMGSPTKGIDIVTEDLVAWWPFDDGIGASASNIMLTGNGQIIGSPTGGGWGTNSALTAFDNPTTFTSDYYADSAYINTWNSYFPTHITITGWAFTGNSSNDAGIFLSSGNWNSYWLGFWGSFQGTLRFLNADNLTIVDPISRSPNRWYHFALSYDGTKAKLYVDGSLVQEKTNASGIRYGGGWPYLNMGAYNSYGGTCCGGGSRSLDDVRIYDRALEPVEIKRIADGKG